MGGGLAGADLGVEGAAGLGRLLAQQLAAAGQRVLDVQPKLAARVRLLQAGDTNKNDPSHARARAELAAEFLAGMRRLDAQLRGTRKKLAAAVRASGTTPAGVFGTGPVIAGTIIGDIAGVSRFPGRGHFAPITAPPRSRCPPGTARSTAYGEVRLNMSTRLALRTSPASPPADPATKEQPR